MKPNENAHRNAIALSILILQLIAWAVTASSLYGDYSSSDAAGNGMARGFALMFVAVPGMAFIFVSNFYAICRESTTCNRV